MEAQREASKPVVLLELRKANWALHIGQTESNVKPESSSTLEAGGADREGSADRDGGAKMGEDEDAGCGCGDGCGAAHPMPTRKHPSKEMCEDANDGRRLTIMKSAFK
ncbi:unnamed protein product [Cuscuta campestris]|uniref:Uncharacterized protein n=1 Tax=Cuscuta campestris TaxID=132261 RepID=A0A484NCW8_9ASTE|nr:unnamed protein product [Cuscuta campestris]